MRVEGMDCASCVGKIETALARMDGVSDARINFTAETLELTLASGGPTQLGHIEKTIKSLGFGVSDVRRHDGSAPAAPAAASTARHQRWWQTKKGKHVLGLGGLMGSAYAIAQFVPGYAEWIFAAAVIAGVLPFARKAFALAVSGSPFSIETLMVVASLGALVIGEAEEAAAVVFLFAIGELLESVAAGRAPWANMYEFTLVGAFCTVLVFLVIQQRLEVRFLGIFVTILSVSALVVALNAFHVAAAGVEPALQSYWLVIHVGIAILATGVFGVAFATSVLQLLQDSRANGSAMLASWHWLDSVPRPAQLEVLSFRINAVGFVMWTFTIIGGSVWAEDAWGRYWGWDPKEVWSFVIWVVYAAYLHARTTRGWSGRRAAWFVVVGFACVLFNFTGVNILFNGKHSYSQI